MPDVQESTGGNPAEEVTGEGISSIPPINGSIARS